MTTIDAGFGRVTATRLLISACALALSTGAAAAKDVLVKDQAAFDEAVGTLEAGDRLVLGDGEWTNAKLVFEASGTEDNPVSLVAQTPGKVVISGEANLQIAGNHLVISGLTFKDGYSPTKEVVSFRVSETKLANNVRFYDNAIINFSKSDRTAEDHWITLYGKNNRVDHNYFTGKTNKGPTLVVRLNTPESRNNKHLIDHNFFGYRSSLGGNGGETLRIGVSDYSRTLSETTVSQNYFEHCDGEVEIISTKAEGNVITENVFFESRGAVVFRHGGNNVVSRNVFFGNGVPDTGGVRVINENQTVKDNYFEGLRGQKFISALTVMNGVPNSPQNRYHQVKNANISNNTLVDIKSIGLAIGSDEERSAVPVDSVFQKNIILSDAQEPVAIFDDISGIAFKDNISNNAKLEPFGATVTPDIELVRADNGLLYPKQGSGLEDVGAPRDLDPIKRDVTGPSWFEKPAQQKASPTKKKVGKTTADLVKAVEASQPGDVLVLKRADYVLDAPLKITHALTIVGPAKRSRKATLSSTGSAVIELYAGARLTLKSVNFEANTKNASIIHAVGDIYKGAYRLETKNVGLVAYSGDQKIPFMAADAATFAEMISLDKFKAEDWHGAILSLSGAEYEGWYLAEDIVINKSSFKNVAGPLIDFGREGRDESTFGPRFAMYGSVLENVSDAGRSINLKGIDGIQISGNKIASSGDIAIKQRVLGLTWDFADNELIETKAPEILDVNGAPMNGQGDQ